MDAAKDSTEPFMVMMWHKVPPSGLGPGPNKLGMYDDVTFPEPVTLFADYSGGREAVSLNNMTIGQYNDTRP